MTIPKEAGGLVFSAPAHRSLLQKFASFCAVTCSTVAVPNSRGPAELLVHYGTDEQKDHYLPRLAVGEEIPCFGLTGPTAGSDATSIPDTGIICKRKYKGKEVLGMRLTFDKRYITLSSVATIVGLAFKLYDPDGLVGAKKDLGISVALIPSDTPGMEIGLRHFPLNVPFHNGPVRGKDVFVPLGTQVGGINMAGQGWRMLMQSLAAGRSISLPALGTAGGKMAALMSGAYARLRKQFNIPIGKFEGIEEPLSRTGRRTSRMDSARMLTLGALDQGESHAPDRQPGRVGGGPVDGIDHPHAAGLEVGRAAFLAEKAVLREALGQACANEVFDVFVGDADHILPVVALVLDIQRLALPIEIHAQLRGFQCETPGAGVAGIDIKVLLGRLAHDRFRKQKRHSSGLFGELVEASSDDQGSETRRCDES